MKRGKLRPAASRRWVATVHDISAHLAGEGSAHFALIYDPIDDVIAAGHVAATRNEAVAGALAEIDHPRGRDPEILACAPGLAAALTLQLGRFRRPPRIVSATPAELTRNEAVCRTFRDRLDPAEAHDRAVRELDAPARRFIASRCWTARADSEPLLLDAVIGGERMGGVVSVMGNGGQTWGVCILPSGSAFTAVTDPAQSDIPPDGAVGCIVDPEAVGVGGADVVTVAYSISEGETHPPDDAETALLHVALVAAIDAPPVGSSMALTGTVDTVVGEVSYTAFDVTGGQAALEKAESAPRRSTRERPGVRFSTAPRAFVERSAGGNDDPVLEHLALVPWLREFPVVVVKRETQAGARELCETIAGGSYMGVSAVPSIGGTDLRLIGLSDPISLGMVATMWSPLRGFMRRRERARGLHLLMVGAVDTDDPEGVFICLLPQRAADLERLPEPPQALRGRTRR